MSGIEILNELNKPMSPELRHALKMIVTKMVEDLEPKYNYEEETADAPAPGCQCEECQYWDAYALKHGVSRSEIEKARPTNG